MLNERKDKNMKKVALHNLGCKVNAYETEAMQEMLEKNGYEIVHLKKVLIFILSIHVPSPIWLTANLVRCFTVRRR